MLSGVRARVANEIVLTKLSYDADGAGTWHLEK